jgi:hypothetical protein
MDWRESRGKEGVRRYRMRQKLVLLGDDGLIENDQGDRVYFVDGRTFHLREHLGFQDTQRNELGLDPGTSHAYQGYVSHIPQG